MVGVDSAVGGDGGGDGDGGEASRLMSRDLSLEPPVVPRKTSGGASLSTAADVVTAGVAATAAALFFESRAAR